MKYLNSRLRAVRSMAVILVSAAMLLSCNTQHNPASSVGVGTLPDPGIPNPVLPYGAEIRDSEDLAKKLKFAVVTGDWIQDQAGDGTAETFGAFPKLPIRAVDRRVELNITESGQLLSLTLEKNQYLAFGGLEIKDPISYVRFRRFTNQDLHLGDRGPGEEWLVAESNTAQGVWGIPLSSLFPLSFENVDPKDLFGTRVEVEIAKRKFEFEIVYRGKGEIVSPRVELPSPSPFSRFGVYSDFHRAQGGPVISYELVQNPSQRALNLWVRVGGIQQNLSGPFEHMDAIAKATLWADEQFCTPVWPSDGIEYEKCSGGRWFPAYYSYSSDVYYDRIKLTVQRDGKESVSFLLEDDVPKAIVLAPQEKVSLMWTLVPEKRDTSCTIPVPRKNWGGFYQSRVSIGQVDIKSRFDRQLWVADPAVSEREIRRAPRPNEAPSPDYDPKQLQVVYEHQHRNLVSVGWHQSAIRDVVSFGCPFTEL